MTDALQAADAHEDLGDLLAAVALGDTGAFSALYAQISPAAFGLAIRVIGDSHLAEEVLQEVFLHIWRNASTFDAGRGAAKGWILMLTHRRSVDRVRSVQSARERDIADAARAAATPAGDKLRRDFGEGGDDEARFDREVVEVSGERPQLIDDVADLRRRHRDRG